MQPSEPAAPLAAGGSPPQRGINGGRFDFDDGGTYCGGWEDGKAHGHGVCTGPKGQGAYAGSWHFGFEVSGVYTWPSGSSYEGQWQNGKRHGLGVESRGRWLYRGEWTQGYKGRYGVRQSTTSTAKYEGTWANGLQDGYGSETYADGGTYQGQWMRGMRHGYGVRTSAPFGLASHYRGGGGGAGGAPRGSVTSLAEPGTPDPAERRTTRMDDARGGFVLKASSDEPTGKGALEKSKKGLFSKLRKQRSASELDKRGASSVRSAGSAGSASSWVSSVDSSHSAATHHSLHTDSNASFVVEDEHLDASVTETYLGEWKNDKRTGFGVSERSDGLRYEGEWFANRKYGYGVTTFRDGTREEGKYKNNVLITSQKRKHMFLMRSAKFRERVDSAVTSAQRASKIALQKADIAISRTATARGKGDQADEAADQAKEDCDIAQMTAKQFAADFKHPGFDRIGLRGKYRQNDTDIRVTVPKKHENEMVLDGKSIPNHIPPTHQQLPQMNQPASALAARRLSNPYPKPPQSVDPRLASGPGYGADERGAPGPAYDAGYREPRSATDAPDGKTYAPTDGYQQPAYRANMVPQQQSLDQSKTPYQGPQQPRRMSSTVRQPANPRAGGAGEWGPAPTRRQSVLAQPPYDPQDAVRDAAALTLGRSELRTGAVYDAPDRRAPADQGYRPPTDQTYRQPVDQSYRQPAEQNYRQPVDQNYRQPVDQNYRQPVDQNYRQPVDQNYRQPVDQNYRQPVDQSYRQPIDQTYRQSGDQNYRQTVDQNYRQPVDQQQLYRQSAVDQTSYRPQPEHEATNGVRELRSNSRPSIDHLDHYQRPPSRDGSVDRYGRRSRQASVEAGAGAGSRGASVAPAPAPARPASRAATPAGNGHLATGRGPAARGMSREPPAAVFEESLLRQRNLGQDIAPSPYQPKRTESLFVPTLPVPAPAPAPRGPSARKVAPAATLQRKKSLPEVQGAAAPGAPAMSREEVSALGSARREEVRRMNYESEKLRANPLLYLVSPQVKDWFSRQQLVLVILFVNISLGLLFYKLLT